MRGKNEQQIKFDGRKQNGLAIDKKFVAARINQQHIPDMDSAVVEKRGDFILRTVKESF